MVDAYLTLLSAPKELVAGKIYNAGFENQPVRVLAQIVRGVIGEDIILETQSTDDNRSYHISSRKIKRELGFEPRHAIEDAVIDLRNAFEANKLPNSMEDEKYFNIRRMQSINLK